MHTYELISQPQFWGPIVVFNEILTLKIAMLASRIQILKGIHVSPRHVKPKPIDYEYEAQELHVHVAQCRRNIRRTP